MENPTTNQLNQISHVHPKMGIWASKTFITAVNMGLFTLLSISDQSEETLKETFSLQAKGLSKLLNTLVALGFLTCNESRSNPMYSITTKTTDFLMGNGKPNFASVNIRVEEKIQ